MPSSVSILALAAASVAGYHLLGSLFRKWAVAHFTVLNELKGLGDARGAQERLKGTAVICGGSVAGLLAARVCSSHFDDVLIIDPDNDVLVARAQASLPPQPGEVVDLDIGHHTRARVMQTQIIHVNQVLNLRALERLFPNFREWLKTIRAPLGPAEWTGDYRDGVQVHSPGEFYPDGVPDVFCTSRGAYETLLRHLVAQVPNVRFVKGIVTDITRAPGQLKRLESVTYRSGEELRAIMVQNAELVVDCSGPGHAGLTWLKHAGFQPPVKEAYNPHLRYYTTEFAVDPTIMAKIIPHGFDRSTPYILLNTNKLDRDDKMLAITQIEDSRIHVMSGGWGFKGETTTVANLREYASSLRQAHPVPQWLHDLFDYLEREPEKTAINNVRAAGPLHYIKYHDICRKLPCNFVALGDAAMRLNPVFGQGLTKAMIGAIVLNSCLTHEATSITALATRFFKDLHAKLGSAWDNTKYVDYQLDTTEPAQGETLASGAPLRWVFRQIEDLEIAGDRQAIWRKFEVIHWIAPPTVFVTPRMLSKMVWNVLKTRWAVNGQKGQ